MKVDTQDVINRVIDAGFYGTGLATMYMCWALVYAFDAGVISKDEKEITETEINDYLNKINPQIVNSLRQALYDRWNVNMYKYQNGRQRWVREVGLPFYRNWRNRPDPSEPKFKVPQ